jgi:signal transduction histidine kinase
MRRAASREKAGPVFGMTLWPRVQAAIEARPWLVVLGAAAIALPTIVLGEIAATDTRYRLREAQLQAQSAACVRAANRVSFILAEVADKLDIESRPNTALAAAAAAGDLNAIKIALREAATRVTYTWAWSYFFVDTQGVIRAGWKTAGSSGAISQQIGQRGDVLPWVETPQSKVGARFMAPDEFRSTFAGPQLYLSDLVIPTDASGQAMARGTSAGRWATGEERDGHTFTMAARILGPGGRVVGALAAEIVGGPFNDAVFELQGISTNAYLFDRAGRLVRRMEFIDIDFLSGSDWSEAEALKAVIAGGSLRGEGPNPLTGVPSLLSSARAPDRLGRLGADLRTGWIVVAAEPLNELYADVDSSAGVLRAIRLALAAGILLFAALLAYAIRRVSRQRLALQGANASLEQVGRELAAATRHKSEFLANMSHELRTPLNAIIGFSDVLSARMFGELNQKQSEYVTDISTSGRHLLDLVNDVLDLAKVEAGRMELQLASFNLGETVTAALAYVRERAIRRGVELTAILPADLQPIDGDERKVRQVLLNLLSNAVKFTPDGGHIDVSVRRAEHEIEISVRDTGIGISAEDQARVFEEFRQVGETSVRSEGTGLGLTLTKRFVELHGGRIWVDSTPGKGSTFSFTLPLHRSAPVNV